LSNVSVGRLEETGDHDAFGDMDDTGRDAILNMVESGYDWGQEGRAGKE
jgi:hypothetical protein